MNERRLLHHVMRRLRRRSLPALNADLKYATHLLVNEGMEGMAYTVVHRRQQKHGVIDLMELIHELGKLVEERRGCE
jgi:hypothetical protein